MKEYDNLKLNNQLCFSLYALSREIIKLYKPLLDKLNLTYTQYLVMLVLWEDNRISVKNLGNRLHLDSGTLTPLLKKLQDLNLITKSRSKEDDRIVIIELTKKGEELKEEAKDIPTKILCELNADKDKVLIIKNQLDELLENLK